MDKFKTDYVDSEFSGDRQYDIKIDGIIHSGSTIADTTEYSEKGDQVGAKEFNAIGAALNELDDRGSANQLATAIGGIETTSTATSAYEEGQFIVWNNALYKVTAAIAIGDTLSVSTNLKATNVASELTALNNTLVPYERRRRRAKKQLSSAEITAVKSLITNGYFNAPVDIIDGDYFMGTSGFKYTLGHYNYLKGNVTQYSVIKQNHYALVVDTMSGYSVKWAENDTTPYSSSTIRSYLVNTALPKVKTDMAALGFSVLSRQCLEGTTATSAGTTGWGWVANEQIIALSESQVYGGTIAASSFFDEGEANRQLECFRNFSFMDICDMKYLWLKERSSRASCACSADGVGGAARGHAGVGYAYAAFGLIIVA